MNHAPSLQDDAGRWAPPAASKAQEPIPVVGAAPGGSFSHKRNRVLSEVLRLRGLTCAELAKVTHLARVDVANALFSLVTAGLVTAGSPRTCRIRCITDFTWRPVPPHGG